MLALSRKKNEAIIINNDIEITVLEVKGDQASPLPRKCPSTARKYTYRSRKPTGLRWMLTVWKH